MVWWFDLKIGQKAWQKLLPAWTIIH